MLSFNHLPRMMVVQLMKTVVFNVSTVVWKRGVSQIVPRLTIAEGVVLDFNLHFRVTYGGFLQNF